MYVDLWCCEWFGGAYFGYAASCAPMWGWVFWYCLLADWSGLALCGCFLRCLVCGWLFWFVGLLLFGVPFNVFGMCGSPALLEAAEIDQWWQGGYHMACEGNTSLVARFVLPIFYQLCLFFLCGGFCFFLWVVDAHSLVGYQYWIFRWVFLGDLCSVLIALGGVLFRCVYGSQVNGTYFFLCFWCRFFRSVHICLSWCRVCSHSMAFWSIPHHRLGWSGCFIGDLLGQCASQLGTWPWCSAWLLPIGAPLPLLCLCVDVGWVLVGEWIKSHRYWFCYVVGGWLILIEFKLCVSVVVCACTSSGALYPIWNIRLQGGLFFTFWCFLLFLFSVCVDWSLVCVESIWGQFLWFVFCQWGCHSALVWGHRGQLPT